MKTEELWRVEYSPTFREWWDTLSEDERRSIVPYINMLKEKGPNLIFPYSSGIEGSRHKRMRELRPQHCGRPYRILYAFDPLRSAILLVGGDKTGKDRWYRIFIPIADEEYDKHLENLRKRGKI